MNKIITENKEAISYVLGLIDILIVSYNQEEREYPFTIDKNIESFWEGRMEALKDIKDMLEN